MLLCLKLHIKDTVTYLGPLERNHSDCYLVLFLWTQDQLGLFVTDKKHRKNDNLEILLKATIVEGITYLLSTPHPTLPKR